VAGEYAESEVFLISEKILAVVVALTLTYELSL
jgi:hypothetical protein